MMTKVRWPGTAAAVGCVTTMAPTIKLSGCRQVKGEFLGAGCGSVWLLLCALALAPLPAPILAGRLRSIFAGHFEGLHEPSDLHELVRQDAERIGQPLHHRVLRRWQRPVAVFDAGEYFAIDAGLLRQLHLCQPRDFPGDRQ